MRIVFAVFLMWVAVSALAQTAILLRADTLRAEPFADSTPVAQAATGETVRLLERKGSWTQVEAGDKKGWLRALNLRPEGTAAIKRDGVLAIETGRQAHGGMSVPLAIRGLSPPRISGAAALVLEDIYESRDKSRVATIKANRAVDGTLAVDVQSQQARFVYVFMASNASEMLQCLFPNANQPDNEVAAGKPVRIPAGSLRAESKGPVMFLAVVTDVPLDLVIEGKQAEGSMFKLVVTTENRDMLATALSGGAAYGAATTALR